MKSLILTLILVTTVLVNSLEPGSSGVNHLINYHGLLSEALPKTSAPVYGRIVNLYDPSRVDLLLPGGKSYVAWAINPLVVIGRARNLRAGCMIRSFRSTNPRDTRRYFHKIKNTNIDKNLNIYVIELERPIKLTRPMAGALEDFRYSDDALHFAEGVANAIIESRYGPAPPPVPSKIFPDWNQFF